MPELNGLEAARQIRHSLPQTEVLILTIHESEELMRQVVSAGVRGYILKSDAGRLVVEAVAALLEHQPFFTRRLTNVVLQGCLQGWAGEKAGQMLGGELTGREQEVVQLIAEGKSNKEMASQLGISVGTVETHRANIMRKLNLHSVGALVRYAIRNKLVEA
jgi:DNA-binding NarL/FixJ family response regulator